MREIASSLIATNITPLFTNLCRLAMTTGLYKEHSAGWVSRVELATGKQTPLREVKLSNKADSISKVELMATEDGKVYVYRVRRNSETLYMAEGLE